MQPRPCSDPAATASSEVQLRPSRVGDGAAIWRFIAEHGGLEANTAYAYLVLADDFADTCVVAEDDGQLVGFVLGYRPPSRPDTLFVWQIGVAPSHRGQGLARRMILQVLARHTAVTHLEATVAPSNTASQRLFRSIAEAHDTSCDVTDYLSAQMFPEPGHEAEDRFRIGPL